MSEILVLTGEGEQHKRQLLLYVVLFVPNR